VARYIRNFWASFLRGFSAYFAVFETTDKTTASVTAMRAESLVAVDFMGMCFR
jgi:hypothetical protein